MRKVTKFLEDYALAEKGAIQGGELDNRITALRELGRNFDTMNGSQFVETMTTAHFTQYFGDALSRAFYEDYEYKIGDWPNYVFMDTVPDFRDVDRYRMTEAVISPAVAGGQRLLFHPVITIIMVD